jgi:hypothetical protein
MSSNLGLEQAHQRGRHEGVVVWDFGADNLFVFEVLPEASCQLCAVVLLHDEDNLCPFQKLRRAWNFGIRAETGRGDIQVRAARENMLGCGAPKSVAAA